MRAFDQERSAKQCRDKLEQMLKVSARALARVVEGGVKGWRRKGRGEGCYGGVKSVVAEITPRTQT